MVVFARRPVAPKVEVSAALRGTGEAGPGGHSPGGHLRDGEGAVDRLWQSRLHVSDHQDSRHLPLEPEPVQCILPRTVASSVLQINPYSQYSLNDLNMVLFFKKKQKTKRSTCMLTSPRCLSKANMNQFSSRFNFIPGVPEVAQKIHSRKKITVSWKGQEYRRAANV